jgi:hypothetical protein
MKALRSFNSLEVFVSLQSIISQKTLILSKFMTTLRHIMHTTKQGTCLKLFVCHPQNIQNNKISFSTHHMP